MNEKNLGTGAFGGQICHVQNIPHCEYRITKSIAFARGALNSLT
jgi:hypothetical protein